MMRAPLARTAAGLVLVALAMAVVAGVAVATQSWRVEQADRLEQSQAANARLSSALVQGRLLRDASTVGGSTAFTQDYLESGQDSIATADLQSRLRALALEKRVDLSSLNTLTPRQSGDVTLVGVRISFRAPLPDIQALLHATETMQPLLFIERLGIRADAALGRNALDVGDIGPALAVEMDVYAPKRPKSLASTTAPAVRIEPATGVRP